MTRFLGDWNLLMLIQQLYQMNYEMTRFLGDWNNTFFKSNVAILLRNDPIFRGLKLRHQPLLVGSLELRNVPIFRGLKLSSVEPSSSSIWLRNDPIFRGLKRKPRVFIIFYAYYEMTRFLGDWNAHSKFPSLRVRTLRNDLKSVKKTTTACCF